MNCESDNLGKDPKAPLAQPARRAAFSLIELLVVIGVIALLAALTVAAISRVGDKGRESKIRAGLDELVTAIESYKADRGVYPPDNPNNPAVPPLFYELSGVAIHQENGEFFYHTEGRGEVISPDQAQSWFGIEGFQNAVEDPAQPRSYLNPRADSYAEVSNPPQDAEVLIVPVPWPLNLPSALHPVPSKPGLNPWRYRNPENRSATNNPGSFELWAEYVDGKRFQDTDGRQKMEVRVISNWRQEPHFGRPLVLQ